MNYVSFDCYAKKLLNDLTFFFTFFIFTSKEFIKEVKFLKLKKWKNKAYRKFNWVKDFIRMWKTAGQDRKCDFNVKRWSNSPSQEKWWDEDLALKTQLQFGAKPQHEFGRAFLDFF